MAKVLIVEDDADIRNAFAHGLTHAGYQMMIAGNAEEAAKQLQADTPDVMVLDLLMPGISGVEFLKQEKVSQRFPDMKILVFTNIDSPRVMDEAKSLGITEYIVKVTTTPSELAAKIQTLLKK
ncbi:MAG TPA: response regulator [Candidatus Saccharimonadales bacterium]|nr:response regulator [Candidatus Saccharimonadales bacterium]